MKKFSDYNPIAVFLFLISAIIPSMFCMDPVFLIISFLGSFALFLFAAGVNQIKSILWLFLIPLIGIVLNPLFNHNGMTVLFLINHSPITLEAAEYGLTFGLMLSTVLLWFKSFSIIMTSDRLLYIFGAISPKISLILSMTIRYIPMFKRQYQKVSRVQKALGLFKEDNLIDRIKAGLRVFSIMVTWALENGVVTADSMTARGYGVGHRTQFAIFKWRIEDFALVTVSIIGIAVSFYGIAKGILGYAYYPTVVRPTLHGARLLILVFYLIFVFLPTYLNIREALTWRSLRSEI